MVSRETAPGPPPAAVQVFGDALAGACRYAELLAGEAVTRGLIGPREVPRLWERHLLNCAVVAPAVQKGAVVCDLGSGAGLPGIVWALLRSDLRLTLLEPMQRRVDFLIEAARALGLGHVDVVRGRADGQAGTMSFDLASFDMASFDVVAARAVAPLRKLAQWALPLVRPDGELLALKGASAAADVAAAEPVLRRLGAAHWTVERWGADVLDPPATLVRVRAGGSAA